MQLLSMEVNQLGASDRTQVGTLSRGLNAVCGRRGSGKSSLLRWLRGMILPAPVRTQSAAGQVEHASGRLSLEINGVEYQLERYERAGKTVSKILRPSLSPWNQGPSSWNGSAAAAQHPNPHETISQLQREAFDLLASIPSDGQSIDRLWQRARDLNLDEVAKPRYADVRGQLTAREFELADELQPFETLTTNREALLERRRGLDADLDRARRESAARRYTPDTDEYRRLSDRLAVVDADGRKLSEEIAEIDAQLLRSRDGGHIGGGSPFRTAPGISFKERLVALDAQLARWRNTLTEIRSHRERLEACATDAQLDGQLGEQFSPVNQATPRVALRALEAQIMESRRHFDALLEGVDRYRTEQEDARHQLPQTLRLMQRELHEVCQQLSRYESLTANRAMKDQILQLARCESEMRQSIERLIAERGELMRTIASACQLSVDQVAVAYSDSCRCADHPQLDSWLAAISSGAADHGQLQDPSAQWFRHDELARLETRRVQAVARLEDCQREYRELESRLRRVGNLPVAPQPLERSEEAILQELDQVSEELLRLEKRDRLRVELSEVRRRLQQLPREVEDANSLRGRYERHLAGLTGRAASRQPSGYRRFDASHSDAPLAAPHFAATSFELDASLDPAFDVGARSGRLEEVALRLAIIEMLAARGHPIPLVLDQTLDNLDAPQCLTAVRYLAGVADIAKLQVVALTDDQVLMDAVKAARGNVVPLVVSRAVTSTPQPAELDVNRQLLAFANDFEADKWSDPAGSKQPPVPPTPPEPKGRSSLSERSDVEQIPSVNARASARLRALGIDTVGDLLEADYSWLIENARLEGIPTEAIDTWQSEARLLCAMPQLRPFDARVLAGAGVRDHRQLAEMHPSHLLEYVEDFLATDRGRRIMRSGTTYELSRITAWIASAKRGSGERPKATRRNAEHAETPRDSATPRDAVTSRDSVGGVHTPAPFDRESNGSRSRTGRAQGQRSQERPDTIPTYQIIERDDQSQEDQPIAAARPERRRSRRQRAVREAAMHQGSVEASARQESNSPASAGRFYLEPSHPIAQAPSIGPNMAQQLSKLNIETVAQLLAASADDVARDLEQPRITGNVVRAWQEQAQLVCRIPNLRGRAAQILVACGVTSPEALARMEPTALLKKATAFVNSTQGQRVLRGSEAPNAEEVQNWIRWASHSRALLAA